MKKTMSSVFAEEYLTRRISPAETFSDLMRFPRFLEIETVHACNANCDMCTIHQGARPEGIMSDKLFEKIVSELMGHTDEVLRVSLYKDGEPLLDTRLSDRISRLKEIGINNVMISTNASLLTEAKATEILKAGLDTIIISMDSICREIYESIRIGLDFHKVLENTLRFIELRNKLRPETQVWLRMIRQEKNWNEWSDYHIFWKKQVSSQDRVNYHTIHNWGGQLEHFKPVASSYQPFLPCVALWSHLVIFINGDVPLCTLDFENKYPNGNIKKKSISELWHSNVMQKRREQHLCGDKGSISICGTCNAWDESPDAAMVSSDYAAMNADLIPKGHKFHLNR